MSSRRFQIANTGRAASLASLFLALLTSESACGQNNSDFQIVLVSDTFFLAARPIGGELLDGRYVMAEEKTMHSLKDKKVRAASVLTYAIDCQEPKKIVLVSSAYNIETQPNAEPRWGVNIESDFEKNGLNLKALKYATLAEFNEERAKLLAEGGGKRFTEYWPPSPNVVSEYACRVASSRGSEKSIAEDVLKTGGTKNMKELSCELTFSGGEEKSATVRFHDQLGYVQVNDKWKLKSFVNDLSVGFNADDGTVTRINRSTGKFSITPKEGPPFATGTCAIAQNTPKKF